MYHPYKNGYSVLPELKKLGDGPVFERTSDHPRYRDAKRNAVNQRRCFFTQDVSQEILQTVAAWVMKHHPNAFEEPHDFESLLMQIQEDIVIHRIKDGRDWVAAAHVCFPSSWDPADVVGKNFHAVHQPVPDMDLRHSAKIAEAIVQQGPFERFQWGVFFEDRLDYHPDGPPKKKFDPENPFVVVKVERQITWGFPKLGAAAFVLRQHLLPEHSLDKAALSASVSNMSQKQLSYKGITQCAPKLVEYLLG